MSGKLRVRISTCVIVMMFGCYSLVAKAEMPPPLPFIGGLFSFEECLRKVKELNDDARAAGDVAWSIISSNIKTRRSPTITKESTAWYKRASDLRDLSSELLKTCRPGQTEKSSEARWQRGWERLKDASLRNTHPITREIIHQNLQLIEDHNRDLMGWLSGVEQQMASLNVPETSENTGMNGSQLIHQQSRKGGSPESAVSVETVFRNTVWELVSSSGDNQVIWFVANGTALVGNRFITSCDQHSGRPCGRKERWWKHSETSIRFTNEVYSALCEMSVVDGIVSSICGRFAPNDNESFRFKNLEYLRKLSIVESWPETVVRRGNFALQ